jgi:hypothetical protein
MNGKKGAGSKGDGKNGGVLVARIKGWDELEQASAVEPNLKMGRDGNGKPGVAFRKPGSQNARKGGTGRGWRHTPNRSFENWKREQES